MMHTLLAVLVVGVVVIGLGVDAGVLVGWVRKRRAVGARDQCRAEPRADDATAGGDLK